MQWDANNTVTANNYLTGTNSLRAPIFYDSNDTGHYLNPASTSRLNRIDVDIMYDRDNTSYYVRPGSTSLFNDARANIFYSRSNTGYYSDPESTSRLNQVTANSIDATNINNTDVWSGDINVGGDANTYYPVTWYGGNQAIVCEIEIYRNYSETAPSTWYSSTHKGGLVFRHSTNFGGWGGSTYNWTVEDIRETYSTIVADVQRFANSRGWCIWLRGGGAVYHVRIKGRSVGPTVTYGSYDPGNNGTGVTSRTDTPKTNINSRYHLRGQYVYADRFYDNNNSSYYLDPASTSYLNDLRASIYYDRDNTGYYSNPASDSTFNTATFNGRLKFDNYLVSKDSGGMMGSYNVTSTADKVIWTIGESWPLANMYGLGYSYNGTYGHHLALKNNGSTYHRISFASQGASFSGTVVASSDFRAPIFYDSNDTGYYSNPASTSRYVEARATKRLHIGDETNLYNGVYQGSALNRPDLTIKGQYPQLNIMATRINNSTHGATLRFTAYDSANASSGNKKHWVIGTPGTNATMLSFGYTPNNDNPHYGIGRGWSSGNNVAIMWIQNDRHVYTENSFRAPQFTDSDNTGYYLNPASTSNLNALTTNTRAKWGMSRYTTSRESRTSDQNYWTGTHGWGTGDGTWSTAFKGGFSGWDIWGSNTDHPQGAGYIHAQGIVSGQHFATSDGARGYGWQMVGATNATSNRYWARGKWSTSISGWKEFAMYGGGGSGDLRASRFYDSDNTAYYSDPASTSNYNALNVGGLPVLTGTSIQNYTRNVDIGSFFNITDDMNAAEVAYQLSGGGATSRVTKVDDPTAPAAGCFEVNGQWYPTHSDYIKIDANSQYIFEVWVRFVAGTDSSSALYMGGSAYNAAKSYFGNTNRYWGASYMEIDANTRNSGEWYKVSGRLGGNGGQGFTSGTEYIRPLFLFNYAGNSTHITRYCGLKLYKAEKTVGRLHFHSGTRFSELNTDNRYPYIEGEGQKQIKIQNSSGWTKIGALNTSYTYY